MYQLSQGMLMETILKKLGHFRKTSEIAGIKDEILAVHPTQFSIFKLEN